MGDVMVGPDHDSAIATSEPLAVNTAVAVRNRELGTWSHGFHVAAIVSDGCLVRRLSDGFVLPARFSWLEVHAI
jgi:hypothetical protein